MTENHETLPAGEPETSVEAAVGATGAWDDLQVGFSDNQTTKMDERGRLKLPAEFRAFIEKKYGKGFNAFYITSQDEETAEIYPMPEWVPQYAKILKLPRTLPARKKLLKLCSLYGARVDMDPQGRLTLPDELRKKRVLVGEVMLSGEGNLIRVSSLEGLRESVKQNPFTDEDAESLVPYDL